MTWRLLLHNAFVVRRPIRGALVYEHVTHGKARNCTNLVGT